MACGNASLAAPPRTAASEAVPVNVVHEGGRYRLFRSGQPYEIRGAGLAGNMEALAAHGGNSFRTWSTNDAGKVLDDALRLGLTVALCIEIGRERQGFDYDDERAVAAQLEFARGEVLKYKDHPALLLWIIGNEPNLQFENPKVFDAIDDISRMIHALDRAHPATTALAGFGKELAGLIDERAPDLDFVSIQMYGDAVNLPRYIEEMTYRKPYLVTEWGAIGHWEVPTTSWGAPIEQNSSEKAASYRASYEAIVSDGSRLLGSFVFLWGQKQERTPTWYGMFLADGSPTGTVDLMHYLWNGAWPDNRSPRIETMLFDAKTASENIRIASGGKYTANVIASDPDGDVLQYRWEIMRESEATQTGGDFEETPQALQGPIDDGAAGRAHVTAPNEPGAYRLFVYVHDGRGSAGHANIPFIVE
jgi:hypothetical protein